MLYPCNEFKNYPLAMLGRSVRRGPEPLHPEALLTLVSLLDEVEGILGDDANIKGKLTEAYRRFQGTP